MEFFEVNPTTGSLIDKLNSEIAGTIQTLESNQTSMKQKQKEIGEQVTAIKGSTDNLAESEFPTLRRDFEKLIKKQIDSDTITDIQEKTKKIDAALTAISENIGNVENSQQEQLSKFLAQFAALDEKLKANKKVQDQCAEQLSESGMLFGTLKDLAEKEKTDAAGLEQKLSALAADIARVEEKVDTANQNSAAIRTDIQEMRSTLTEQLSAISQTVQESAKAAADNQRMLQMISAYLSLPGYKSFFKGMGRIENEQIEG